MARFSELLLPVETGLGLEPALACVGGAGGGDGAPNSTSGWFSLVQPLAAVVAPKPVPTATDGFFAIAGYVSRLTPEAALASLSVVVTDEGGDEVAGELSLLSSNDSSGEVVVGWTATVGLAAGTRLRMVASAPAVRDAAPEISLEVELIVVGEPTPLPKTSAALRWADFFRGVPGAMVSCETNPDSCGGHSVDVPAAVEVRQTGIATWQVPPVESGVAWRAHLETSSADSDAEVLEATGINFWGQPPPEKWEVGRIVYSARASRHCATLVVEDLRSGETVHSELCDVTASTREVFTDTKVASCLETPNENLEEAWCRLRSVDDPSQCAPGGAGATSTEGHATGGDTGGDDVEAPSAASASAPRTSTGCQFGGSSSPAAGLALLSLALTWLAKRRCAKTAPV